MIPVILATVALPLACTVHVTLAVSIAKERSGRVGLLAFLVFPLAPILGWQSGKRIQSALWVGFTATYAVALMGTVA